MSDEIMDLRRELDSLRHRVRAVESRGEVIPIGSTVKMVTRQFGDLLRDPDDEKEAEILRRKISELEDWLYRYE